MNRIAGARATHPDFRYQPIAKPEELGNGGRVQWVSGRPGEAPARPGLISSLPGTAGLPPFIFFSTSYPELDSAERQYLSPAGFEPRRLRIFVLHLFSNETGIS
jgi:hypothetical protein